MYHLLKFLVVILILTPQTNQAAPIVRLSNNFIDLGQP